jgi:hypothetical protein
MGEINHCFAELELLGDKGYTLGYSKSVSLFQEVPWCLVKFLADSHDEGYFVFGVAHKAGAKPVLAIPVVSEEPVRVNPGKPSGYLDASTADGAGVERVRETVAGGRDTSAAEVDASCLSVATASPWFDGHTLPLDQL